MSVQFDGCTPLCDLQGFDKGGTAGRQQQGGEEKNICKNVQGQELAFEKLKKLFIVEGSTVMTIFIFNCTFFKAVVISIYCRALLLLTDFHQAGKSSISFTYNDSNFYFSFC